ncbi:hypothetical protein BDZ85DRAFT_270761 [Elsinoe ampelina]|uniref:Uncharacterized protein n=1 Tax=Elsinoe ampelina TaxID=302913 RepID=A0A6A6FXU8_9PEZI|nr:hypothetical protein BDZ85DRAFT_270761 [Elsinoe ampelina]
MRQTQISLGPLFFGGTGLFRTLGVAVCHANEIGHVLFDVDHCCLSHHHEPWFPEHSPPGLGQIRPRVDESTTEPASVLQQACLRLSKSIARLASNLPTLSSFLTVGPQRGYFRLNLGVRASCRSLFGTDIGCFRLDKNVVVRVLAVWNRGSRRIDGTDCDHFDQKPANVSACVQAIW